MERTLTVGIVVTAGLAFGEVAKRLKLPKVTGYIVAGVLLNPALLGIIPPEFPEQTEVVTNIALSFITFMVGGSLAFSRIKKQGKAIGWITILEAEFAFLCVAGGFCLLGMFGVAGMSGPFLASALPFALLIASLASPTDPSATLAVRDEYNAEGEVTSTILGAAAFDDALGMINYSLATAVATTLVASTAFSPASSLGEPLLEIGGSILCGVCGGLLLHGLSKLLHEDEHGGLIVRTMAMVTLTYGVAEASGCDPLLATMAMGAFAINMNPRFQQALETLKEYAEELIFVLFFTLSAMHLDFGALSGALGLVGAFVLLRASGKLLGASLGGRLGDAPPKVRRYAAAGLIPQGGIVIGLALMMNRVPEFEPFAKQLVSVIIGATVIHELTGPILAKIALRKAGEIKT